MTARTLRFVVRPFFSYYGSKWRIATRYPEPRHHLLIESHAGSAGYALRYPHHEVRLYDVDPHIVGIWTYLLRATARELVALPDVPLEGSVEDLRIPEEARWLIGFWLAKGRMHPPRTPSGWMRKGDREHSFWGPSVRAKLARQIDRIRHWTVDLRDYRDIPDPRRPATWFVDPPYSGDAGRKYRFDKLDYSALADWCRERRGQVIVCEGAGATWLPFRPLEEGDGYLTVNSREKRRAVELVWTNDQPASDPLGTLALTPTAPRAKHGAPMITQIRTNLKAYAGELCMPVQQRTAILDAWSTGKTRWLRAVTFAMTGTLPGTSRPKEAFETWAPPGATELFAELLLSDGSMYLARIYKGDDGWVLSHHVPEAVRKLSEAARARSLPLSSARAVITKGADLGRRELILRFAEGVTAAAPDKLSASDRQAWESTATSALTEIPKDKNRTLSGPPDPSEVLIYLQKIFHAGMVAVKKEINALEKESSAEVPAAAGSEQIPALKEQLLQAQRWESAEGVRTRRRAAVANRDANLSAKSSYQQNIDQWNAEAGARAAHRQMLQDAITSAESEETAARTALEKQEELLANGRAYTAGIDASLDAVRASGAPIHDHTLGTCALCAATDRPLMQIRINLGERVEARASLVSEARAVVRAAAEKKAAATTALATFEGQITGAVQQAEAYMRQLAASIASSDAAIIELDRMAAEMGAVEEYKGLTASELTQKLDLLQKAATAREEYEKKLKLIESKKTIHEAYTRLKKAAVETLTTLVETAATRAEAEVARRIPAGRKARFNRDDCCWEVWSERDRRWHTEISGCGDEVSWLILGVALAYTYDAPNRVVMLDGADLGEMDPRGLAVFENQPDLQVLIAWTRPQEIGLDWYRVDATGKPWDALAPAAAAAPVAAPAPHSVDPGVYVAPETTVTPAGTVEPASAPFGAFAPVPATIEAVEPPPAAAAPAPAAPAPAPAAFAFGALPSLPI